MDKVTVRAPVNIAVIKYWGKRDESLNLPLHSSVSMTLDMNTMYTETTVERCQGGSSVELNGVAGQPNNRVQRVLTKVELESGENVNAKVVTLNTFPTAAGLASSASGYAALAVALSSLYSLKSDVSVLARLGSGSACRSVKGGFVTWDMGTKCDGSDSTARQVSSSWDSLRVLVCVVSSSSKEVPSSLGMQRTVNTSGLLEARVKGIKSKVLEMESAIIAKDFPKFAELTMRDSNEMHACCADTFPPIQYMNSTSHSIVKFVHSYNEYRNRMCVGYTFDAGPNAVLVCEEKDSEDVEGALLSIFRKGVAHPACALKGLAGTVEKVIKCRIGGGPVVENKRQKVDQKS